MKPATFNCTVLRDGHQSLAATRMSTEQMLEIAPILDTMGFSALETWGGASIDSGLRFLGEHPFDRLDTLKKLAPKTPHMMLLRGQNMVGYTNYADDVVEAFVKTSAKHGMNIFRIFDCLNDPQNMRTSIKAAKEAGGGMAAIREAVGADFPVLVKVNTNCAGEADAAYAEDIVYYCKQFEALGADAIVGVRYASSAVMQSAAEVMAYGTAVKYRV